MKAHPGLHPDALCTATFHEAKVSFAERLCLELRDHVAKLDLGTAAQPAEIVPPSAEDAIAALITLGYSNKEAQDKVRKLVVRQPDASTEELIKTVLRG